MSVFQWSAGRQASYENTPIDSINITLLNQETREVDLLLEMSNPKGTILRRLLNLSASPESGSLLMLTHIQTNGLPFELRIVTNIYNPDSLFIVMEVMQNEEIIAAYTARHFMITD